MSGAPTMLVNHQAEVAAGEPWPRFPDGWLLDTNVVHVYSNGDWLCIDGRHARTVKLRRQREVRRMWELPLTTTTIEIEGLTSDHARGYTWTTGFIGSGQRVAGTTGVLVSYPGGYVMLRYRMPPLQVKATWAGVLKPQGQSLPPPPPPPPSQPSSSPPPPPPPAPPGG